RIRVRSTLPQVHCAPLEPETMIALTKLGRRVYYRDISANYVSDVSCSHASPKSRAIFGSNISFLEIITLLSRHQDCEVLSMLQPSLSVSETLAGYSSESNGSIAKRRLRFLQVATHRSWLDGIQRRWQRERRRRKVGRAYDMALEIARILPIKSRVLDVGCGNGFIAHHLSAMLNARAIGIDLDAQTEAAIDYRQFDGKQFPVGDR